MRAILVGGQYGDEGKGKIISHIALEDKPEIIARGGVGPNAGHEVHYNGKKYPMRMLSCGFVYDKAKVMIGAGVLVNPSVFLKEVEMTDTKGRSFVDFRSSIIEQEHIDRDSKSANSQKIGTTKTGCGPTMEDRVGRRVKRAEDIPELKGYLIDVAKEVNKSNKVLIEGSQGFMLSNYFGTYPYVTSKDVSASSMAADVGLGPTSIDKVIMVIKAYTTRVGNGPFPDETSTEEAKSLGFQEYGTVTGRPRRTSKNLHWDDLRFASMVNGATDIAVTKLDILFPGNDGVREYDKLTDDAKAFVKKIEDELKLPVSLIGTGPDALDIVDRRDWRI